MKCGQVANMHQMSVDHTITMSTAASGTLLSPEKIGMNSRLARRLTANGTARLRGAFPWNTLKNTKPKLIAMTG